LLILINIPLLPYNKIIRVVAIVLILILLFFPGWLPFGVSAANSGLLTGALFIVLILSLLNRIRLERVTEAYLASAKNRLNITQYLKHLSDLEAHIIKKIEKERGSKDIVYVLEQKLKIVRREQAQYSRDGG